LLPGGKLCVQFYVKSYQTRPRLSRLFFAPAACKGPVFSILPAIAGYLCLQKHIIGGVVAGP